MCDSVAMVCIDPVCYSVAYHAKFWYWPSENRHHVWVLRRKGISLQKHPKPFYSFANRSLVAYEVIAEFEDHRLPEECSAFPPWSLLYIRLHFGSLNWTVGSYSMENPGFLTVFFEKKSIFFNHNDIRGIAGQQNFASFLKSRHFYWKHCYNRFLFVQK